MYERIISDVHLCWKAYLVRYQIINTVIWYC